jgi:hypothetical protein
MANLPRRPNRGDDILYAFLKLYDCVKRNALVSVVGGTLKQTDAGQTLVLRQNFGKAGSSVDFAWNVVEDAGLDVTVTPGDIELGPDTVIAWGSITNAATTVSITASSTTWWIWVNIDMANETAEMFDGASITALSSTEQKTILQKRIAKITLSSDVVTTIARYQCGNIFIPRL